MFVSSFLCLLFDEERTDIFEFDTEDEGFNGAIESKCPCFAKIYSIEQLNKVSYFRAFCRAPGDGSDKEMAFAE